MGSTRNKGRGTSRKPASRVLNKRRIDVLLETGLVYDALMLRHFEPTGLHVEKPERISAIFDALTMAGIVERCKRVDAEKVKEEVILLVHEKKYIDRFLSWPKCTHRQRMLDSFEYVSVYLNKHSTEAALYSCGSIVKLTEMVVKRDLKNAVAVVRPPGHHAEEDHGMGFCLLNNVAIAAAYANQKLGIDRILILDWDVHFGNGTQHLFYSNPYILFFSLHRFDKGLFDPAGPDGGPTYVGEGDGKGFNINVGWNTTNVGDAAYLAAFNQILKPVCQSWKPQLILISAGFDSARGDPLGQIDVTPAGYSQMTKMLMEFAEDGKVVVCLEGGYNLNSISESMKAVVTVLLGDEPSQIEDEEVGISCQDSIDETIEAHKLYWPCLNKQ